MKHPQLFSSLTVLLFSLSAFSCVHRSSPPDYEILKSYKPSSCWEEVARNVQVSPDGKMAVFYHGSDFQQKIVDLQSGQVIQTKLLEALDELWYARFYHDSRLALLGRRGDEEGWYLEEPDGIMLSSLPSDARPFN